MNIQYRETWIVARRRHLDSCIPFCLALGWRVQHLVSLDREKSVTQDWEKKASSLILFTGAVTTRLPIYFPLFHVICLVYVDVSEVKYTITKMDFI